MITALELKTKLENIEKFRFRKFFTIFGILPSLFTFPMNYFFNYSHIDPVVRSSPIMLGFGFLAFIMVCLVLSVSGLIALHFSINRYLSTTPKILDAVGRFNINTILRDGYVLREMAKGIHKYLKEFRKEDFELQIQEVKDKNEADKKELKNNIDEIKNDFMPEFQKVNLALYEEKHKNKILMQNLEKVTKESLKKDEEIKRLKGE